MRIRRSVILWFFCVLLATCNDGPEEYLKEHKKDVLRVVADGPSLPGDGESAIKISAYISKNADLKRIRFTTTSGKFRFSDSTSYTVNAAAYENDLRADAFLISSAEAVEDVLVRVTASSVDTLLHLNFTVAPADSIANESTVASIKRGYGSEVPVKTILFRKDGKPSEHQTVTFEAYKDKNSSIGEFRTISSDGSDKDGIVNSVFMLKDTLYTGPLKIVSKYQNAKVYTDTLFIFVTNK